MTDFASFARAHGLLIDRLHESSRIQRCPTEDHPHSKNGAYLFEGDRGWVQDWAGDMEIHWWDDPNKKEPTQAQKDEWERRKKAKEEEQVRIWGSACRDAKILRSKCVLKEHDYLHRKGLGDIKGLVTPEGELFVPMHNFRSDELIGYQTIFWDHDERKWVKKMKFGTRAKGAVLQMGPKHAPSDVILCEGYATGLSINKAMAQLRLPGMVIVCFSAGNIIEVASHIKHSRSYIFADNDESKTGEQSALRTGLAYCMSPVVGEDANDLHVRAGIVPVMDLIMETRRKSLAR